MGSELLHQLDTAFEKKADQDLAVEELTEQKSILVENLISSQRLALDAIN